MAFRSFAAEIGAALLDFLFPQTCGVCGAGTECENGVCASCTERISSLAAGHPVPSRRDIPHVRSATVLLPYTDEIRTLIHSLKYHGVRDAGIFIGGLLAHKVLAEKGRSPDMLLVPVPLHPRKLSERGYNQSERIAHGMSLSGGFPVLEQAVERAKYTGSQTGLDAVRRSRNVSGVFRVTDGEAVRGRDVIIVDDVLTTGATISECAAELQRAGARSIHAAVAAAPSVHDDA